MTDENIRVGYEYGKECKILDNDKNIDELINE